MEKKEAQSPELRKIDQEFQRSVTLVSAKPKLKRYGLALWTAVDIILLTIFFGYLGYYFLFGTFVDNRQIAKVGNNIETSRAVSVARSAKPLQVETARVLQFETDKYDFYALVENLNEDWYAQFDYYFTANSGDSTRYRGFVLPNDDRMITAFAEEFERRPLNSELVIENIKWSRVDAHTIKDVSAWLGEHDNFIVEDQVFSQDLALKESNIARSSFTVINNTPYSYWSPVFTVMLERGGSVQAINVVTIPGFESGERREIDVNWFGTVPSSATVRVVPNINYFDEEVYMPPQGEPVDETREL